MSKSDRDFWDKSEIVIKFFGVILVPVALAFIGHSFSEAISLRESLQRKGELDLKYVELATEVLRMPPEESNEGLRNWSIDVVNHYSNVPLNELSITEMRRFKLPFDKNNCSTLGCIYVRELLEAMKSNNHFVAEKYLYQSVYVTCKTNNSKDDKLCGEPTDWIKVKFLEEFKVNGFHSLATNQNRRNEYYAKVNLKYRDIRNTKPVGVVFSFWERENGLFLRSIYIVDNI